MTVEQLIEALGGPTTLGASLGVGQSAVSNWRERGLPAWAHSHIRRLCDERGLDPGEEAFETAAPRRSKQQAA